MMNASKIQFSAAEQELIKNAEIILTKNTVLAKIKNLLEQVAGQQSAFTQNKDAELFSIPPKISKGENYLGLPYLILDYPRVSVPHDFFFIRTMFWWGNFFSSTLHVAGGRKNKVRQALSEKNDLLKDKNYYLAIGADPWAHHFEESNYKKWKELKEEEKNRYLEEQEQIKIAALWPLDDPQSMANPLFESWKFLLSLGGSVT
jgi:hypothetical protein